MKCTQAPGPTIQDSPQHAPPPPFLYHFPEQPALGWITKDGLSNHVELACVPGWQSQCGPLGGLGDAGNGVLSCVNAAGRGSFWGPH